MGTHDGHTLEYPSRAQRFGTIYYAFDILCTDAIMPGQTVIQLIQRFGQINPGRPILVVSGYLPDELLPALRANPQVRILLKPVSCDQMIQAIETGPGIAAPDRV